MILLETGISAKMVFSCQACGRESEDLDVIRRCVRTTTPQPEGLNPGQEILLSLVGLKGGLAYTRAKFVRFVLVPTSEESGHEWAVELDHPLHLEEVWGEGGEDTGPFARRVADLTYVLDPDKVAQDPRWTDVTSNSILRDKMAESDAWLVKDACRLFV